MKGKIAVLCIMAVLFFTINPANSAIIPNSEIQVFGTIGPPQYPPSHTIDNDLNTFWHGTNGIEIGMTNYLAYRFNQPYSVERIDFFSWAYLMGELDIQISQDSTNGLDGTWTTIDHIDGDFNPPDGDFTRIVNVESTSWVRFWMTYQGRGAQGVSPAFYLSEVDFYSPLTPVCDFQMSHMDYITSDTVIAEVLRLANTGTDVNDNEYRATS